MQLNPYLHFNGNAEEVLEFYKSIFGGEIVMLSRYHEAPMPVDEDWKEKIMHARWVFSNNLVMISDAFKGMEMKMDGNIQLSVEMDSVEQLNEAFPKLAEGGTITMELNDTFWGARFGMLKDKFGIGWMLNFTYNK